MPTVEPSEAINSGAERDDASSVSSGSFPTTSFPSISSPTAAAEAYRKWSAKSADLIGNYLESIEDRPVGPSVEPGWLLGELPESPPLSAEDFSAVLSDVEELIVPALVHWQSPGFHGYFPANTTWPAAMGDLVSAGLGQIGMLWATSPAATELEIRMLDWVAELCGLPERFRHAAEGPGGGVIQDSASSGTLVALVAARESAGGRDVLHKQVIYTSSEAHSSVVKGARVAGFRDSLIREVAVDTHQAMDSEALRHQMASDAEANLIPTAVVATVGTTSTMAVDPVREIALIASLHGAWVHVDAAMAGAATICEEHRDLTDGLELADSYLFNPHKWWGVTFDCTTMWFADREPVIAALSITPPYLRDAVATSDEVTDFRDWQIQLGRRFRSLKLWFVLRAIGSDGLRQMIRTHIGEAEWLAQQVTDSGIWEHAAAPRLNLVCIRHVDGGSETQRVLKRINESNEALLTPTVIQDEPVIRLSVGSPFATRSDTERLWGLLSDS